MPIPAARAAFSSSTTGRRLRTHRHGAAGRARRSRSSPIRTRRCFTPPTAISISPSSRSIWRISTRCGCAQPDCARSTAPGNLPILAVAEPDDNARMAARARDRRQRLSACARSTRTSCWRGCAPRCASAATPNGCATISRLSIEMAITDPLTGLSQPPLHGKPSRDAGRAARRRAASRSRRWCSTSTISRRSTTPTATTSATTCCASSPCASAFDPRHRSRLPLRRRGIRHRHAGDRHGGGGHGRRAAAPAHCR